MDQRVIIPLALVGTSVLSLFVIYKYSFLFIFLGTLLYFIFLLYRNCFAADGNKLTTKDFFMNLLYISPILLVSKNAWQVYGIEIDKKTVMEDSNLWSIYVVLYLLILIQALIVFWATHEFLSSDDFVVFNSFKRIIYFVFIFVFSMFILPLTYELTRVGINR